MVFTNAEADSESGDRDKILALTFIALAMLMIPLLLFIIFLSAFFAVLNFIDLFNTPSIIAGLKTLVFIACSGGLSIPTRYLIKWLKR